jgi:hypothetical protein
MVNQFFLTDNGPTELQRNLGAEIPPQVALIRAWRAED